jgi:N-acetylneuraminic acid mutarotase
MPTPRTEIAGAAIDMDVYIIGGFDGSGRAVSTVEVYDSNNDTWRAASPLPFELHHAAAASFEEKLYVVGGYFADGQPSDKLLAYDPTLDEWNELSPMPTARGALTVNFAGGILYAIGGASTNFGTGAPLNITEAYDTVADRWTSKQGMPTPRQHLASVLSDEKIYVIAGRIDSLSSNLDSNEVYEPAKDEWTSLAPMPSKRGGLAAAASTTNGWIYVFGGEEPAGTFRLVERYSPDGDSWEAVLDMPNARHGLAAVAVGNEIHVIGGGPRPGLSVGDFNQILHTRYMIQ